MSAPSDVTADAFAPRHRHVMDPVSSAFWFDGVHAVPWPIYVRVSGAELEIESAEGAIFQRVPLADVSFSEAFRHAPRMLGLPGGVTVEVDDADQSFDRALVAAGFAPSPVVRMQRAWPAALVALAGLIALIAWAYLKGVPALADSLARALPPSLEQSMGDRFIDWLDRSQFKPSTLPVEQRDRLLQKFAATAAIAAPDVKYRIEFREGGVNAFALPGGIIVVLDELVRKAGGDDAVLGVMGHELGHVAYRHTTRHLFQQAGVGVLAGLLWGDFSTAAAHIPVMLGVLQYSREFEYEADGFAIDFLRAGRISPRPLADFFTKLEDTNGESRRRGGEVPSFLSSHPATADRIDRLEEAARAFEKSQGEAK